LKQAADKVQRVTMELSGHSPFIVHADADIDKAVNMAILAKLGKEALAVTTNCSIDFMRKPSGEADLIANCEILKFGKSLVVADAKVYSEGSEKPVARASVTYSIPPKK
ncbi:MAG: aldehyde dehydrogenase family protein, partial [Rhodobacterales bacterium]|nr:aldehyde dehydrogenase family protein [Rhodobacterales bacterium]